MLRPPINDGRKPRAAGANECPAMKRIEAADATSWRVWCDFNASIW